jgi:hypothetical protein
MPRILIVTDSTEDAGEVVYTEQVGPVHLQGDHAGRLLVERLAWALEDAKRVERKRLDGRRSRHGVERSAPQRKEQRWIPT